MQVAKNALRRFLTDESGLETVEYAVMTALIVAALIAAITLLAGTITARFGAVEQVIGGIQ